MSSEVTPAAIDSREVAIALTEKAFDRWIAPINLGGADQLIDGALRAAIRPVVGRLYDVLAKRLSGVL